MFVGFWIAAENACKNIPHLFSFSFRNSSPTLSPNTNWRRQSASKLVILSETFFLPAGITQCRSDIQQWLLGFWIHVCSRQEKWFVNVIFLCKLHLNILFNNIWWWWWFTNGETEAKNLVTGSQERTVDSQRKEVGRDLRKSSGPAPG